MLILKTNVSSSGNDVIILQFAYFQDGRQKLIKTRILFISSQKINLSVTMTY